MSERTSPAPASPYNHCKTQQLICDCGSATALKNNAYPVRRDWWNSRGWGWAGEFWKHVVKPQKQQGGRLWSNSPWTEGASSSPCQAGSTEVSVITLGPFILDMAKRCHMTFDEQIIIGPEGGSPKKVSISSELSFRLHRHQQISSSIPHSFQMQTEFSTQEFAMHLKDSMNSSQWDLGITVLTRGRQVGNSEMLPPGNSAHRVQQNSLTALPDRPPCDYSVLI